MIRMKVPYFQANAVRVIELEVLVVKLILRFENPPSHVNDPTDVIHAVSDHSRLHTLL